MNRNAILNQNASSTLLGAAGAARSFGLFTGVAGFGTSCQTGYCWQQATR